MNQPPLFMGSGASRLPIEREERQVEILTEVFVLKSERVPLRQCIVSSVERPGHRSQWTLATGATEAPQFDAALSRARQPRLPGLGPAPLELEPQGAEAPAVIRYVVLWPYESQGGERLAVASCHYRPPSCFVSDDDDEKHVKHVKVLPDGRALIPVERLLHWDKAEPLRKQLDGGASTHARLFSVIERLISRPRKRSPGAGAAGQLLWPQVLDTVRCDRLVRLPAGGLYPLSLDALGCACQ